MNIKECARRMKIAGLWMTILPVAIFIIYAVYDAISTIRDYGGYQPNYGTLELLAPAVPGLLLLLASWIVSGLAQP